MSTETRIAPRGSTAPMTQKYAAYLLKTVWPKAPDVEVVKAAILCWQYNLNPLRKQVSLVQFGNDWAAVIGIEAKRLMAKNAGHHWQIIDGPRMMTEEEQKSILGAVDQPNLWAIIKLKEGEAVYPGYGCIAKSTKVYGTDKGNSIQNMAFIHAESNALSRMAPGEMPEVEVTDEHFMPTDIKVTVKEGEQEASQRAQEDIEDFWPGGAEKFDDNSAAPHLEKPGRTEAQIASIQTINQLYLALKTDFGLEPGDIFKELGIKDFTYLTEKPADAYRRVAAVRK